jgi:hypothetical protein
MRALLLLADFGVGDFSFFCGTGLVEGGFPPLFLCAPYERATKRGHSQRILSHVVFVIFSRLLLGERGWERLPTSGM